MKEREEEKDSRRSLLEEGRHVARLCFRLFFGCIVRKRAHKFPSFLLISLLLGRFRSNVSLRSHADNFLSFAGDKETLTRTGVADLSFGSTCHRVYVRRRRGQFLTLFPPWSFRLKLQLWKKKKKRQGRRRNVEQCLPSPPPETLFYYHVRW